MNSVSNSMISRRRCAWNSGLKLFCQDSTNTKILRTNEELTKGYNACDQAHTFTLVEDC